MKKLISLLFILFALTACDAKVKQYKVRVLAEYPHDVTSYTQGLFFYNGQMYESTGQYGLSTFRKVDIATGEPLEKLKFNRRYFAEGSVQLHGNIYILTWESKVAFIYDAETLEYKSTYSYPREGWGLTTDGEYLIASDGSSKLYYLTDDFKLVKTVSVKLDSKPIRYLNELEYIDGKVWANVYMTDMIVIIDPETGVVEGTIDCSGLLPDSLRDADTDVLNGIAYDPDHDKLYLTGKNWKRLYEVELVQQK